VHRSSHVRGNSCVYRILVQRETWDVVMRCAFHILAPLYSSCLLHVYIFRKMLCKQQIISARLTIFEDDGNACKEHETMKSLETLNFTFILDCFHFFFMLFSPCIVI
jgi:hypothetical protein